MDASGGDESGDQAPGCSEDERNQSVLTTDSYPSWAINRREARQTNLEMIEWERPAQKAIKEGMWVYASRWQDIGHVKPSVRVTIKVQVQSFCSTTIRGFDSEILPRILFSDVSIGSISM